MNGKHRDQSASASNRESYGPSAIDQVGPRHPPDEDILRHQARHAIAVGRLPPRPPDRIWSAHGNGERCAVCGNAVLARELSFELEVLNDNGVVALVVHIPCYAAWDHESSPSNGSGVRVLFGQSPRGMIARRDREQP